MEKNEMMKYCVVKFDKHFWILFIDHIFAKSSDRKESVTKNNDLYLFHI